jgi:hydrogenase maturation protease
VAVGDPEAGKDAVGPLILAQMLRQGLPPKVRAHSIGRRADRLPDLFTRTVAGGVRPSLLILLDAVTSPTEVPGTLVEQPITRVEGVPPGLSSHDTTLEEAVGLLHLQLGSDAPIRIVLLGVIVGPQADGPMPEAVAGAIPRAAARARQLIERPPPEAGDLSRNEPARG